MTVYEKAVQGQLEAYNKHDIKAFLRWYAEDVKIYDMDTDELLYESRETMRTRYARVFENEHLYCKLDNRMVLNRTIIDYEHVTKDETDNLLKVIAIYDVNEEGLIQTVRFTKGKQ